MYSIYFLFLWDLIFNYYIILAIKILYKTDNDDNNVGNSQIYNKIMIFMGYCLILLVIR